MNHDRIEIEFAPEPSGNPANWGGRKTWTLSDSRSTRYSVHETHEGVRVHTSLYGEAGTLVKQNTICFPWHRIHEVRYYGEH